MVKANSELTPLINTKQNVNIMTTIAIITIVVVSVVLK